MPTVAEVVQACLKNPALKAKLIADPAATLAEHGVKIPAGAAVKVVENTATHFHIVLPKTDASDELSDDDLEAAAGGGPMITPY